MHFGDAYWSHRRELPGETANEEQVLQAASGSRRRRERDGRRQRRPVRAAIKFRRPTLGSVREYGIVASFAAIFITLSIASSIFLTKHNLLNVVDQS